MTTQKTTFNPAFSLYNYLERLAGPRATIKLGGSATPALSLSDLVSLSTDPEHTRRVLSDSLFSQRLGLGSDRGSPALRAAIAATYVSTSNITADNVIVANGTTGANHIVERTLLSSGDHVIVQYPIYGPCIEEPLAIGCSLSYLRADASNGWRVNADDLRGLIQPGKTKMIFLNNPGNPTGSYIDSDTQRSIIKIAKQHDLIIHCDEIFRPFFHEPHAQVTMPHSFVEHPDLEYDKVVVTSSMSKCYGLSGVRVGWITTTSPSLYEQFLIYRMFSVQSVSALDDTVAAEVLSPRCRPAILQKHLNLAKQNIDLIDAFIKKYPGRVDWVKPTAGSVGFVRFLDPKTGKGRNDVEFCERLIQKKGVLLSPGSLCFEFEDGKALDENGFKGRVRMHFTCPTEMLETGIRGIEQFLDDEEVQGLTNGYTS